jgi:hypothetical protein
MNLHSASAAVRRRLTFANSVSLLALFVALGGSSYAALSVGSGQIANNSVRTQDLRNNTILSRDVRDNVLLGRDIHRDSVEGRNVNESTLGTVPDAGKLGGQSPSAFLPAGSLKKTGLIRFSRGQTKPIAKSGPYSWTGTCSDDGGGSTRLTVKVSSSVGGGYAGDFQGQTIPIPAKGSATIFDNASATPVYSIGFPLSAVATSGGSPVGISFGGIKVAGSDCVVNGFLLP